MVDTLASGASRRKPMRVQLPPSAPRQNCALNKKTHSCVIFWLDREMTNIIKQFQIKIL